MRTVVNGLTVQEQIAMRRTLNMILGVLQEMPENVSTAQFAFNKKPLDSKLRYSHGEPPVQHAATVAYWNTTGNLIDFVPRNDQPEITCCQIEGVKLESTLLLVGEMALSHLIGIGFNRVDVAEDNRKHHDEVCLTITMA